MELTPEVLDFLETHVSNQAWRLENLYYIKDKQGKKVLFKPNWAQRELLADPHNQAIVLKCRQLGVTSLHSLLWLDEAMFACLPGILGIGEPKAINCGIIAHRREDSEAIFTDKVKFAYDNMPEWTKEINSATNDNARELRFKDGSTFRVSSSMRSGTFQRLLISEMGRICRINPTLANEIVSGSLQTVAHNERVVIESTAEGRTGYFYDYCVEAMKLKEAGKPLSSMDKAFFFFPWFKEPEYSLDADVDITKEQLDYFHELEQTLDIKLSAGQRAWYVKKSASLQELMLQEYPSTPQEAFAESTEGYYYSKDMAIARRAGRICQVPYDPFANVHTAWDLGINDATSIFCFQIIRNEIHVIDYYENSGESLKHYCKYLDEKNKIWSDLTYGIHLLPHDVAQRELSSGVTRISTLSDLGYRPTIVPKANIADGIHAVRTILHRCWFDTINCDRGVKCLESYRKDFSAKYGTYTDRPYHDEYSHGADSFRYLAQGLDLIQKATGGMTEQEANKMQNEYMFRYE